jgi:hypothetical protein
MSQPQTFTIVVGTSEPLDFELRDKGIAIDGSGLTIALAITQLVDGQPATVTSPPTVAWLDIAAGTVRVSGAGALPVGNYLVRYQVTDNGGRVGFFPNGDKADIWRVVPVPAR